MTAPITRAQLLATAAGAGACAITGRELGATESARWSSSDPQFAGNFAPVFDERSIVDLPVTGSIPAELEGIYLRNGPNPQFRPIVYHYPLDGDGMLHAIRLRDGKASYQNKWVVTSALQAERRAGHALYGSIIAPIRVDRRYVRAGDDAFVKNVANTNIIFHGGRYLALYEGGLPYEITGSLATRGAYDFAGRVQSSVAAHPKIDPKTGHLHFFGYSLSAPPYVTYYVANRDGVVITVAPLDFPHATIVHDCQITEHSIVFAATPLLFNTAAARAGQNPFSWQPDLGTTFVVVDRANPHAKPLRIKTEPLFFWHYVNGHETAEGFQLDFVRNDRAFTPGPPSMLHRVNLNRRTATGTVAQLDDHVTEFPRINPAQTGSGYRFAYMPVARKGDDATFTGLMQYDALRHTAKVHDFAPHGQPEEASVITKHNARSPDDTWILAFVYDASTRKSDFVILDSRAFGSPPVATIHLPVRVPFGLHGNWVPA